MLVLLSGALVLVATVLLVLGLVNDELSLIYVSIGCSLVAAVVLVAAVRRARPAEPLAIPTAGAPAPPPVAAATAAPVAAPPPAAPVAPIPADTEQVPVTAASEWAPSEDDDWEGEEVEFPIADYDDLTDRQILPLLPQLYADELDVVEERERITKARPNVLDRIAELRGAPFEPAEAAEAEPVPADDAPAHGDALVAGGVAAAAVAEPDPAPAPAATRSRTSTPAKKATSTKKAATKKAAPTKASAKKVATKAAPAKKTAATKKSATATKSTATRKAAPIKKATPVKKTTAAKKTTTAKKAAPAKQAAPVKKAAKKTT